MTPESFHSEASADETHSQIGAACTVKGVAAEALVEEDSLFPKCRPLGRPHHLNLC